MNFEINSYQPGKIICVGMNYKSHVKEQDGRFPTAPVLFCKAASSLIKNMDTIIKPRETEELDYEVELGVIIGKVMKNIAPEDVNDFIYGYTIVNDVTARDLQKKEGQWFRAKSFDTFAPVGPVIIPKSEIKDPQNLNLKSYVNGVKKQDSNTNDMIFKITGLISFMSKSMTLVPGDLISTGTPAGVAAFIEGAKFLQDGDEIECEIESIGRLANKVKFI
jgi:2-keto-4-pentenoate hydratase/2-oxohepta-3-ene-1,7-dioic acid hydratase in catechol pathway